jgi:tetratricopeptide (TPR) repeat protein
VSDLPSGYRDIPDEDRKKAQVFFDRGNTVANTGNFEYAISMYLDGLKIDPENTAAHQTLREISLKRKASGGKDLGFMEKMKLRKGTKEDKDDLLNAEKLLAYDPGNTDHMVSMLKSAHGGGYWDTAMWVGNMLFKANDDLGEKASFSKYIILRDTYKGLKQWQEAVNACQRAAAMKPDDMDLQTELKHLGAQLTMIQGKYGGGGGFRDSMRDREKQEALMESDKDIRTADSMRKAVADAENEWKAEPDEPGKLTKYVDALRKTEDADLENQAIELCESAYKRTGQFRWRKVAGEVKLGQLARMERSIIAQLRADPASEDLKQQYKQFHKDRIEEELKEYTLWAENYPTESQFRFAMAQRMFELGKYDEAIPVFQNARQDPKHRTEATILLGRAFLEAGYVDEAADTLREVIEGYQLRGDEKSIMMYYYYARVLEQKGETAAAIKAYSQVAQWNFNYRDVQSRIKRLRSGGTPPAASA